MRHVTEATREAINAFARERGIHKLDSLRSEGLYQALLGWDDHGIALDKHGRTMLQERTGLTSAQLDKALKLLSDAGVVDLGADYTKVFVTVRPER